MAAGGGGADAVRGRPMGASGYELASLIDLDRVQRLCDSLSEAFDVTLAVLDLSGKVLIATGWQDICTRFHRENAETLQGCLESDLSINRRLVEGLDASEHYAYRCRNGLWDVAFPLVIAGEHVANVYTGQFFFDDDRVDREEFAARARRLGFDEAAYLEALDKVPVISHAQLQTTLGFLNDFVGMLGEMGLSSLERERKHAALKESEERYRRLFDNATEGLIMFRAERAEDGEVEDVVIVDLNPIQTERTGVRRDELAGHRLSEVDPADERLGAYFDAVASAVASGRSMPLGGVPAHARRLRAALGLPGRRRPVGALGHRRDRAARGGGGAAPAGGVDPARLRRRPRRRHRRQAHPADRRGDAGRAGDPGPRSGLVLRALRARRRAADRGGRRRGGASPGGSGTPTC